MTQCQEKNTLFQKKFDFIANAHKVLDNYNGQKFHDNLENLLHKKGLKKGVFCKQIGKPANWLPRRLKWKPEFAVLIKMQDIGYDILELAGLYPKRKIIEIPYNNKDVEIEIRGKKIKRSSIILKVNLILFYGGPLKNFLIDDINRYYQTMQDNIPSQRMKL
ncbi:MAG: hypothetical protein ACFFDN_13595 [Candidatus Hodarchaeota archaeon]